MTRLTNSFHGTEAFIRATVPEGKYQGPEVSPAVVRRVRRRLCGISTCTCGREDGTRGSRYRIEDFGRVGQPLYYVTDTTVEVTGVRS